ncbi:MAG: clostripain-related cysteine peptidase, partial [Clostridia bacterium]|nr:clostripain-related cysteine peptidase [Clostridia bacterium]
MDKRPHSRDKNVSGSSGVNKGGRVNTGGHSVGGSGRPSGSSHSSYSSHSSGSSYSGGSQRGRASGGGGAGCLLSLLFALPSGVRRILILIIAIVAVIYFVRSCNGGGLSVPNFGDGTMNIPSGWTEGISGSPTYSDHDADVSVASTARDRYTALKGSGEDVVTIMIYMCGTDLESKYGMATSDLKEMMAANIADNVNIIVETGGCKSWQTSGISNSVNQIYKIESGSKTLLEKDFGKAAMTDPANLTQFIDYCEKNYPANRNILIFWDHGGGSLTGYGYDEKNTSAGSMTLPKINQALSAADCKFDWIGFDACLMATLETALVCNNYADYLIASEEVEPGTGWYYTSWVNAISKNTSVSTVSLSKTLIDSYMQANRGSLVTLSVTDLAELQGTIPDRFTKFSTSISDMLADGQYDKVSGARASTRQFSEKSRINQVDLCDLAERLGNAESKALVTALKSCIKYNGSSISHANGLSIYFPYENTSNMKSAESVYKSLGMDSEYIGCIKSFASTTGAGQTISLFGSSSASSSPALPGSSGGSLGGDLFGMVLSQLGGGSSASPIGSLLGTVLNSSGAASAGSSLDVSSILGLLTGMSGRSMPDSLSWMDTDQVAATADDIAKLCIDPGRIVISQNNGQRVLSLTEKEWALIRTAELNVYVDDGEGFIDLGYDNTFDFVNDTDMSLEFDGTWLALNGHTVAYYLVSDVDNGDGTYTTTGRIPCLLNGELTDLCVVFD